MEARLQLHHAAQLAASVGATYLEPRPDDSHPNLGWSGSLGALVGRLVSPGRSFRAGLRIGTLELLLLDPDGTVVETLPLDGRTLQEASGSLTRAISRYGAEVPGAGLTSPGYEIPTHAVVGGGRFSRGPGVDLGEMSRWFANGQRAMTELVSKFDGGAEVRCWPHHFDIGSSLAVETADDGALTKTVGVGLSPGDGSYAEPYWYVSPWPRPDAASLPDLPAGGRWHTEGFTAAVLTGADLLAGGPASEQGPRTATFLDAAVAASRRLLA